MYLIKDCIINATISTGAIFKKLDNNGAAYIWSYVATPLKKPTKKPQKTEKPINFKFYFAPEETMISLHFFGL